MPKKPRQAHIPQQVRRRRARRGSAVILPEAPQFAEEPAAMVAPGVQGEPVPARARRRLEALTRTTDATAVRTAPGQLPTFDRAYLVDELRRITITAGALLALIIVLTVILR